MGVEVVETDFDPEVEGVEEVEAFEPLLDLCSRLEESWPLEAKRPEESLTRLIETD